MAMSHNLLELELALKNERFKSLMLLKFIEKLTPEEEMQKAINELAEELGFKQV
jgi:hypothetical protein